MSARSGVGPGLFKAVDRAIHRVALWSDQLSGLICAVLIVVTTVAMIVFRLGVSIAWLDDVLSLLLIWLVYLGTVSLCLDNDHISMDALYLLLPEPARKAMDIIIALLGVGLCMFVTKIGFDSMRQEMAYGTLLPSGYLPAWPQTLAIPLAFGLMAVAYVSYVFSVISGRRQRPISEPERLVEGV